jgi:hypothetical protein
MVFIVSILMHFFFCVFEFFATASKFKLLLTIVVTFFLHKFLIVFVIKVGYGFKYIVVAYIRELWFDFSL